MTRASGVCRSRRRRSWRRSAPGSARSVTIVRRRQPDPDGPVRQGRPQDRGDAAATWRGRPRPAGPGWPRSGSRRSSRTCSPPLNARARNGVPVVLLHQGRPAGDLLLLLPVGRGLRARVHQGLRLLPVPGQGLAQRPRVGQTPGQPRPGSGSPSCPTGSPPAPTPPGLQAICDRLGPGTIEVFFERWMSRAAAAVDRRRPGRRLLVGAVDAPDRGLPHHGLRRTPPRPRRSSRPWSSTTSTSAAPTASS